MMLVGMIEGWGRDREMRVWREGVIWMGMWIVELIVVMIWGMEVWVWEE